MRIRIGKKTSKNPTQGQVFGGHCHNFIRVISGILKTVVHAPPRCRKNVEKPMFFLVFCLPVAAGTHSHKMEQHFAPSFFPGKSWKTIPQGMMFFQNAHPSPPMKCYIAF